MSCGGNCDKSSSEQGSDPWEAFIGAAAQGAIGYSDAYSGLGGSLGDWDGAGVITSDLFGKKKKKKPYEHPCVASCKNKACYRCNGCRYVLWSKCEDGWCSYECTWGTPDLSGFGDLAEDATAMG